MDSLRGRIYRGGRDPLEGIGVGAVGPRSTRAEDIAQSAAQRARNKSWKLYVNAKVEADA